MGSGAAFAELKFRDPVRARALASALTRTVRSSGRETISVMHVCGSHEQSIARFGLRAVFPPELAVIMGPGCPVCVTDPAEVDEAVALALAGHRVATYGDMLKVPGSSRSLADAQAEGGIVHVVYSPQQVVELARAHPQEQVVFFASGFETTAVATAAVLLNGAPDNLSVLSAHRYVPPAMDVVAGMPERRVEAFLAAGHAAAITGSAIFEPFARRHRTPVVIAGFEPLDVLAALLKVTELVVAGRAEVANMYPRAVTSGGNERAQRALWAVFEAEGGRWRGIEDVPGGNLRLSARWAHVDARRRFRIDLAPLRDRPPPPLARRCICGQIMAGLKQPSDCELFGIECAPESPVGACMVSTEGSCRIWHSYGGLPDLREVS